MAVSGEAGSRFEIVRHLGEGGMGVVYEARDGETGGAVALKTLRVPHADSLLRLKQEFRALQEIHHPNLVRYHALVEEEDRWYLAMELVRGRDLRTYVRSGPGAVPGPSDLAPRDSEVPTPRELPPLELTPPTASRLAALDPGAPTLHDGDRVRRAAGFDEDRLRSVFGQLASALIALHAAGKVHRDVKPSNVLVSDSGRVVLLDFGLVTDAGGGVAWTGNNVVGTVAYMAPEQALGNRSIGPAADWYAVGAMLYELLTGRLPFEGSELRVLAEKQDAAPEPPDAGVPADLSALCMRLLAPAPADRPGGVEVLAAFGESPPLALGTQLTPSGTRAEDLIGRDAALAALEGWLPADGSDGATLVYVIGESGIGKTALVERFLGRCVRAGAVVLRGKCYERETVPFRAVDAVVDTLAGYMKSLPAERAALLVPRRATLLADSFPVLRGVRAFGDLPPIAILDPHERRQLMFDALRELLARIGERARLVVSIDDFHWVDGDSLALLRRVLLPGEAPAMLLVATWRPIGEQREPPDLPGGHNRLLVEALAPADAEALARRRLRGVARARSSLAGAIAREANGHPLFIDELVRHASAEPSERERGATSLDDALWQRVQRLPDDARTLVELVAVAGHPLEPRTLADALGVDATALDGALVMLRVARLTRSSRLRDRDAIEPYHDRVRETVARRLPEAVVRAHHRALARALRSVARPDLEALARHLAAAGEGAEAAVLAERAGAEAVAALAFDRGAEMFRLALALLAEQPAERSRLHAQLGDALAQAGRSVDAARAYQAARDGAATSVALDLQWRAAQQLLVSGHFESGLAALEPVLRARGVAPLSASPRAAMRSLAWQRARLRLRGIAFKPREESELAADELAVIDLYWYVGAALGSSEPIRGNDFYTRGVLAALRAGEPRRVARALYNEAIFRGLAGTRSARTCERLRARAAAVVAALGDPYLEALAAVSRGVAALSSNDFGLAWRLCRRAAEQLRTQCPGTTGELSAARTWACIAGAWAGDFERLGTALRHWLHDSRERGHRLVEQILTTYPEGVLALARDRPDLAVGAACQAVAVEPFGTSNYYGLLLGLEALSYRGEPGRALAMHAAQRAALVRSGLLMLPGFRAGICDALGRAAVAAAALDPAGARAQRRRALRLARKVAGCAVVPALGWAAVIRAGVATVDGRPDRALAELERAEPSLEAAGVRLHVAALRRRRGQLLGGDRGAELAANADAELAATGVVNPSRFAAMLVPGRFPGDEPAGLLAPAG